MDATLSRRDLLRMTAAGIAASVLPHSGIAQARADEPVVGCTLGFSTYGMKTLSTERAIEQIAEIGYDAIEMTVFAGWDADSAKINAQRRKSLRNQLQDSGLKLTSLMEHVAPTNDKLQANAIERLKQAAQLAHDLVPSAPPLVQTVLGGGSFEEAKHQLVDRLGEWVEVADQFNTVLAIKPHRGGVVSTPSEAVWLFEQLKQPKRLRMVYDYSHYAFRDLPLTETIDVALPWTVHIAVKDAVQQKDRVVFKLPGTSNTIDFASLIKRFYEGGYRGDMSCEVSGMVWGQSGYEPVVAAKTCYQNMSEAFKKAGVPRNSNGR